MSGINGDKSRFHRQRKEKIERRQRNRKLLRGSEQAPQATPMKSSKAARRTS